MEKELDKESKEVMTEKEGKVALKILDNLMKRIIDQNEFIYNRIDNVDDFIWEERQNRLNFRKGFIIGVICMIAYRAGCWVAEKL